MRGAQINSSPGIDAGIKPSDDSGNLTREAGKAAGNLEITVYEQGISLVKEKRELLLKKGSIRSNIRILLPELTRLPLSLRTLKIRILSCLNRIMNMIF